MTSGSSVFSSSFILTECAKHLANVFEGQVFQQEAHATTKDALLTPAIQETQTSGNRGSSASNAEGSLKRVIPAIVFQKPWQNPFVSSTYRRSEEWTPAPGTTMTIRVQHALIYRLPAGLGFRSSSTCQRVEVRPCRALLAAGPPG
jgi:hypothetical protein